MPRISPERIFKSHHPRATIERHSTTGGEVYYLVRKQRDAFMWSGEGDTKAQAWKDACERLGLTALASPKPAPATEDAGGGTS